MRSPSIFIFSSIRVCIKETDCLVLQRSFRDVVCSLKLKCHLELTWFLVHYVIVSKLLFHAGCRHCVISTQPAFAGNVHLLPSYCRGQPLVSSPDKQKKISPLIYVKMLQVSKALGETHWRGKEKGGKQRKWWRESKSHDDLGKTGLTFSNL